jgi:multiple sugar transport system ATP-binding protein
MFVAGFVGSPQMNFVKGRLEDTGSGPIFVSGQRRLPLHGYVFTGNHSSGQEVVLGVRPEHLKIVELGAWPGFSVDIIEPMGADTVIWCSDREGSLQVRTSGDARLTRGERLNLGIDAAQVSLFEAGSGQRL